MPKRILTLVGATFAAFLGFLGTSVPAFAASAETVLYSFCSVSGCPDGSGPRGELVMDAAGNLYGTTTAGGANTSACSGIGCGTVFELTLGAGGTWTENVIYSFCSVSGCRDGIVPWGGLTFDAAGNLFGTTVGGGAYTTCGGGGCGVVFELTPNGNGAWTETVLHNFNDDGEDGWEPLSSLIFDTAGNLYGTTFGGGASKARACQGRGCGTVFELTPNASGTWSETVLHSFCPGHGCAGDGSHPLAGLVLDEKGSLYGTTKGGGSHNCGSQGCGVVFELKPSGSGKWKEKVLHTFTAGRDWRYPQTGLILDATGNLYGTTPGTVFELIKKSGWTEKVLHTFGKGKDGAVPSASPVFDANGNLYGTTFFGGSSNAGTVFRLTSQRNGKWTEKILHSFIKDGKDGTLPGSGVIFDTAGNLYGTTAAGGTSGTGCGGSGCGTVFEITP